MNTGNRLLALSRCNRGSDYTRAICSQKSLWSEVIEGAVGLETSYRVRETPVAREKPLAGERFVNGTSSTGGRL